MNRLQRAIHGLTDMIEGLLVPQFLMLFAITVSGFHIYKFVGEADGPLMGAIMGVGVSMMTIFFANRSLRPTGRERWVAMGFLVVFAGLSTVWQYQYQRTHFTASWLAWSVAMSMPIAEIGLGVVAALQRPKNEKAVQTSASAPKAAQRQPSKRRKASNDQRTTQNVGLPIAGSSGAKEQHSESNPASAGHVASAGAEGLGEGATGTEGNGLRSFAGAEQRRDFVEDWLVERLELHRTSAEQWPEVVSQVNVAQLTRELGEILKASNRTIRRDVDAAIERFAVDVEDVNGQLIYQEIEVSTNGKGH